MSRHGSTPSLHPASISPFTHVRTPLSAKRPSLGCSLPGLARFAWQTQITTSLRKPLHNRQPQGTDTHSERLRAQVLFDASPQPSTRPIEGLRSELAPFRGPLAPRLDPPPKETETLQRYKSLQVACAHKSSAFSLSYFSWSSLNNESKHFLDR